MIHINMITKIFKHAVIAFFIAISGSLVLVPAIASADFKSDACAGVTTVAGGATCTAGSGAKIAKIIKFVINILSVIVGFAAVLMIIISGFKFITAGGDASSVASARSTIMYAIIGLVVVAAAQAIVRYVLSKVK